jgi:hypothetical protein
VPKPVIDLSASDPPSRRAFKLAWIGPRVEEGEREGALKIRRVREFV